MWKYLFEFVDRISSLIPVKKWRDYMRVHVLFDYRRKFNALKKKYEYIHFFNTRLSKGGGSIVFIVDNKTTFKVRKYNTESNEFDRFNREKIITDGISPLRKKTDIKFPNIEFIKIDGYTFYKTDFIPGKLLVNIPGWKIKKYMNKISMQLAEFIYLESQIDPVALRKMRGDKQPEFSWIHGDMCSNILINPKTMDITGIIDWEWAKYAPITWEIAGLVRVRKKMRKLELDRYTLDAFNKIKNSKKKS